MLHDACVVGEGGREGEREGKKDGGRKCKREGG